MLGIRYAANFPPVIRPPCKPTVKRAAGFYKKAKKKSAKKKK